MPDAFYSIMRHSLPLFLLVLALSACRPTGPETPFHLQGEAQGTYYSIIYYDSLGRDLTRDLNTRLERFDHTASLWQETSELRRVNSNITDTVSSLFADLFTMSDSIRRYTGGAFDCRVGRIVQAWGFSFRKQEELSTTTLDSLLLAARGAVSLERLPDGVFRLHKEYPATELDFNAIAQGYSVDLLALWFDSLGIHNYLIDIGGEVIAKGSKPGNLPWSVGIERPAADRYSRPEVEIAIRLEDGSVVTSGSYRKYYERDGTRYSHTIDPATGRPVEHSLLSASVVSKHSWYADAMATAFMVMGLEKAIQFIANHPDNADIQAACFIYDDHGEYRTYVTPEFQKLIIE